MAKNDIGENNLSELNENIGKQVSYKETFIRGLITGASTAIGATIIGGIMLALIAGILNQARSFPFIDNIIEHSALKDLVDED